MLIFFNKYILSILYSFGKIINIIKVINNIIEIQQIINASSVLW